MPTKKNRRSHRHTDSQSAQQGAAPNGPQTLRLRPLRRIHVRLLILTALTGSGANDSGRPGGVGKKFRAGTARADTLPPLAGGPPVMSSRHLGAVIRSAPSKV